MHAADSPAPSHATDSLASMHAANPSAPAHAAIPLPLSYLALAVLLIGLYRAGPALSRLTRLPLITLYMLGGIAASHSGALAEPVLEQLLPAHEAALACITFAAGSELVLEQLRANARLVRWLALALCVSSFVIVFGFMLALLTFFPVSAGAEGGSTVNVVVAMLAAVVAIARSPSSAIAVVSELQADGPFTQTVLGVTMVTDVIVILLFTAVAKFGETVLSEGDVGAARCAMGAPIGRSPAGCRHSPRVVPAAHACTVRGPWAALGAPAAPARAGGACESAFRHGTAC